MTGHLSTSLQEPGTRQTIARLGIGLVLPPDSGGEETAIPRWSQASRAPFQAAPRRTDFPSVERMGDGWTIRPTRGPRPLGLSSPGSGLAVSWHFSPAPLPFVYLPWRRRQAAFW